MVSDLEHYTSDRSSVTDFIGFRFGVAGNNLKPKRFDFLPLEIYVRQYSDFRGVRFEIGGLLGEVQLGGGLPHQRETRRLRNHVFAEVL